MWKKNLTFAVLILIFAATMLHAGGKKEEESISVSNLESWQESFTTEGKSAGTYNILVTAEDKGGNTTVVGPYNIYIDPESDLPVTGITNPQNGVKVPGNLNIVGTCIDDDAVDYVEIILDGDRENPIRATGKEFWSYFLNTEDLKDGPHSVEVTGYDIYGVQGHSVTSLWNLDRQQPVTEVQNHEIGELISGKVTLKGIIRDGNGISSLEYSLDNQVTFEETSVKYDKGDDEYTFSISFDTRDLEDGPQVCWFRSVDKMGSDGMTSYLFFVDNTKPDVKIITPLEDESVNGIFQIAGSASDTIGIQSISWEFEKETGEFELIPGNPYWIKEFDIRNTTAKSVDFKLHVTDKAGNTITVKRTIKVDREADLPTVEIVEPEIDASSKTGFLVDDEFYIRGNLYDDDGTAEFHWYIDKQEEQVVPAERVIYVDILSALPEKLVAGTHTFNYYSVDVYGVVGKTSSFPFTIMGDSPSVSMETVTQKIDGKNQDSDYIPGMELHPERNAVLKGTATSDCGLVEVNWKINGAESGSKILKNAKGTSSYEIPLNDAPWGLVQVDVTVEDIYGRTASEKYFVYRTNLTKVRDSSAVVFEDSTSEDGVITFAWSNTASGYFTGGKASSVRLEPDDGFARVKLSGNSIILTSTGKTGKSDPAKVIVTTDKDLEYESEPLVFNVALKAPTLLLDQNQNLALDGFNKVFISGRIGASNAKLKKNTSLDAATIKEEGAYEGDGKVQYRVLSSSADPDAVEWKSLELYGTGDFFVELPASTFDEGIHIVEFAAVEGNSAKTIKAVPVKRVSPLPEPDYVANPKAKPPVAAAPAISWIFGEQLYYTCYYQDELYFSSLMAAGQDLVSTNENIDFLCPEAGAISYSCFPAGKSTAEVKLQDKNQKIKSLKTDVVRPGNASVVIDSVNDATYVSGMKVELPAPGSKDQTASMKVKVKSDLPVTSFTYAIGEGAFVTGKVQKSLTEENVYEVYIPLKDMEAEKTVIKVECVIDKTTNLSASGTIYVTRAAPEAGTEDKEKIYWIETLPKDRTYGYILGKGESVYAYANISAPFKAELHCDQEGLKLKQDGHALIITAAEDGIYENIRITAVDSEGIEYESTDISLLCDTAAPTLEILSPSDQVWLQEYFVLDLDVQDANAIKSVEYSIYDGANWHKVEPDEEGKYSAEVSVKAFLDGLLPLDVKVTDEAGRSTQKHLVMVKDTQAPVVEVVVPEPGASINGKTQYVVRVSDNGRVLSGQVVMPFVEEKDEPVVAEEEQDYVSDEYGAEDENDYYAELAAYLNLETETSHAESTEPVYTREPATIDLDNAAFHTLLIGSEEYPLSNEMYFTFTDKAGNQVKYIEKDYEIDLEKDKPRVEIHLPAEDTTLTTDFTVSGIVYDDDGDSYIWYSIDGAQPVRLPDLVSSWSFDVALSSLTDNEHVIRVYAEDILGVVGDTVEKVIRVSLEDPAGSVIKPVMEESLSGRISIEGKADDGNGIKLVQISVDNGNTWQDAVGLAEWSYSLDTRVIPDGTHVVFLKVWDNYGIQGLYSSLINVDNTAPDINLELPLDDSCITTSRLVLAGQMSDNINLVKLYVKIKNLDLSQDEIPESLAYMELDIEQIINCEIDISQLPNGVYNVEVSGEDAAGNVTRVSRNISVDSQIEPATLRMLYPLDGEHTNGNFNVYGSITSEETVNWISLLVDGKEIATESVTETGYYKFLLTPELLKEGVHTYKFRTTLDSGSIIYSPEQSFTYSPYGPWITIDEFTMGDFAINRPYITGSTGYYLTEAEQAALDSKETSKYEKKKLQEKSVAYIEYSMDNGKSFSLLSEKKTDWKYRIENDEYSEGPHHFIVRATMNDGEIAVTRTIVQIDKTSPTVKLITPIEAGRYNETIDFAGLSSDDVALKSVTLTLRSGNKSSYEVPSFIQGLYLDAHFIGVSLFDIGFGLTFFDDNVKLQAQYGMMTDDQYQWLNKALNTILGNGDVDVGPKRYGGNIFGAKLLANVGSIPFSYFFGPDFNWLSATVALGANFSMFTETQSGKPQILSAFLGQLEFPRISSSTRTMFSSFSVYTEVQVWFIPTDIASAVEIQSVVPQVSLGMRLDVF